MTFLPLFKRHANLWLFLPVFKRHTNLWLFYQFSNDILTYDFFPSFRTAKKRHTNLWLFDQFSDSIKNDIQTYDFFYQFSNDILTYDFFTSFQTGSFRARWRSRQCVSLIIWRSWVQPSHGAWLFLLVFKRHTNLWLFYQFSDDILTYDFFTSFRTTY